MYLKHLMWALIIGAGLAICARVYQESQKPATIEATVVKITTFTVENPVREWYFE